MLRVHRARACSYASNAGFCLHLPMPATSSIPLENQKQFITRMRQVLGAKQPASQLRRSHAGIPSPSEKRKSTEEFSSNTQQPSLSQRLSQTSERNRNWSTNDGLTSNPPLAPSRATSGSASAPTTLPLTPRRMKSAPQIVRPIKSEVRCVCCQIWQYHLTGTVQRFCRILRELLFLRQEDAEEASAKAEKVRTLTNPSNPADDLDLCVN